MLNCPAKRANIGINKQRSCGCNVGIFCEIINKRLIPAWLGLGVVIEKN